MDAKQFETLVQLAHLDVTDEEREGLMQDMGQILNYVNHLQDLDLETLDVARDVRKAETLREDEVVAATAEERAAVLENFPAKTSDDLLEAHAVIDRG